jgi:hypothetical protein
MKTTYGRTVDEALAIAEHEWRVRGIDRRDRAALSADLRLDLEAAAADGITPDRLLGPDVRDFARRLADEAGARCVPYEYRRLLLTALAGAGPGIVVGYLRMYWFPLAIDPTTPVAVVLLVYYGLPAALVLAGALIAVWTRMRDVPGIRRTVAAMSLLLPLAGTAITPITMGFAWLTGYSTQVPVALLELALVASALAGAIVLARRWALREPGGDTTVSAEPGATDQQ